MGKRAEKTNTGNGVKGKHFMMEVDGWDIIGQCTVSFMTVTSVMKQEEGDMYLTIILVLSFMKSSVHVCV